MAEQKLYAALALSHPKLTRGLVACRTCGREQRVDSANAMRSGWPKCCGYTMTLDVEDVRAVRLVEIANAR